MPEFVSLDKSDIQPEIALGLYPPDEFSRIGLPLGNQELTTHLKLDVRLKFVFKCLPSLDAAYGQGHFPGISTELTNSSSTGARCVCRQFISLEERDLRPFALQVIGNRCTYHPAPNHNDFRSG
jgi:hypothetical protein